jgi:hypothetical protein
MILHTPRDGLRLCVALQLRMADFMANFFEGAPADQPQAV